MNKSNSDILNEYNELVKGHETAKKILINSANRSYLRYYQRFGLLMEKEDLISTQNVLLIGGSGTGKTHLVESLHKIMGFPFIRFDATQMNPTSARGDLDADKMLKQIIMHATEIYEKNPNHYFCVDGVMDQMIVFIDEIDKLCISCDSSGHWNDHIQACFLQLFENKKGFEGITFIFAGAFVGIEKQINKTTTIGFNSAASASNDDDTTDYNEHVIKFGMLPELAGRINHIIAIDKLLAADYKNILDTILLPKVSKNLKCYGHKDFKLSLDDESRIIKKAMNSNQGVRLLAKELDKLLVDLEFNQTINYSCLKPNWKTEDFIKEL